MLKPNSRQKRLKQRQSQLELLSLELGQDTSKALTVFLDSLRKTIRDEARRPRMTRNKKRKTR